MATVWTEATVNGLPLATQIIDFSLTAGADGTDSDESDFPVAGRVVRCELYTTDTVADNATIKGYESDALCAVGSRHDFLNYTKSGAAALSAQILPTIQRTDITGSVVSGEYAPPIVSGKLTVAIAGFTEATGIKVRVYVEPQGV